MAVLPAGNNDVVTHGLKSRAGHGGSIIPTNNESTPAMLGRHSAAAATGFAITVAARQRLDRNVWARPSSVGHLIAAWLTPQESTPPAVDSKPVDGYACTLTQVCKKLEPP